MKICSLKEQPKQGNDLVLWPTFLIDVREAGVVFTISIDKKQTRANTTYHAVPCFKVNYDENYFKLLQHK